MPSWCPLHQHPTLEDELSLRAQLYFCHREFYVPYNLRPFEEESTSHLRLPQNLAKSLMYNK